MNNVESQIKILVVGDPFSIHCNRFVNLLQETGYQVRLFSCEFFYNIEEHLKDIILYVDQPKIGPVRGVRIKTTWPLEMDCFRWPKSYSLLNKFFGTGSKKRPREKELARVIGKWRPHVVFSLKMQNEGYTVSKTRELMGDGFTSKWIHFNWGTDIEFFGKHPDYVQAHLPKIKKVLELCDFHIADCHRDAVQALKLGLKGLQLGVCLANGGFDLDTLQTIGDEADKSRKVILIKGRQGGYVGKAFHVLHALRMVPRELLEGYKIRVIMATPDVSGAAQFLSYLDGLDYKVIPRVDYRYLLGLFASSRIAISASDVDGSPVFLAESMAMGAFPIHSDMDSVREWVRHGENGFLFPVDDIQALSNCIIDALRQDRLMESAREINLRITKERMNRDNIRQFIKDTIEQKVLKNILH